MWIDYQFWTKKAWIGQPHMIKELKQTFSHFFTRETVYKTPGRPNFNIIRPSEKYLISERDQALCHVGVGSLLYLVKHSQKDFTNIVSESVNCMGGASPAATKWLLRVITFPIYTENYGLNTGIFICHLVLYTDSDWACDKDCRHSVKWFYYVFARKSHPTMEIQTAKNSCTLELWGGVLCVKRGSKRNQILGTIDGKNRYKNFISLHCSCW